MSDTYASERRRRRFENPETPAPPPAETPSFETQEDGWLPLDDHARSGAHVILRGSEGQTVDGYWRTTRMFDRKQGRFVPSGKWAKHNASGFYVEFEPISYRRP